MRHCAASLENACCLPGVCLVWQCVASLKKALVACRRGRYTVRRKWVSEVLCVTVPLSPLVECRSADLQ